MFERFTEEARRALFFARYNVTQRDGEQIDCSDLLAGLLSSAPDAVLRFAHGDTSNLPGAMSAEDLIRPAISVEEDPERRAVLAREIPFSRDVKLALQRSAEEADALRSADIRPEHLLLGLLRDETTDAWRTLSDAGVTLRSVRRALSTEL